MMAEHTNSMVKMAEPMEIVDINRAAMLGEDPATVACGVDKGDRMECEPQM